MSEDIEIGKAASSFDNFLKEQGTDQDTTEEVRKSVLAFIYLRTGAVLNKTQAKLHHSNEITDYDLEPFPFFGAVRYV